MVNGLLLISVIERMTLEPEIMMVLKNYLKLHQPHGTGPLNQIKLHPLKIKDNVVIATLFLLPDHWNLTVLFLDQDSNHSLNNNYAIAHHHMETTDAMED